jgi:Flp pilus assembly protein TadD
MTTNSIGKRSRLLGLVLTTALASGALTGCTGDRAPDAQVSAGKAGQALEKGRTDAAIRHAEAAVLAEPRAAEHRVVLGATYLQAGRFASAETSFAEAMELGDDSARVVVSRALAMVAVGRADDAHDLLVRHADNIDRADLGLAFAMAGDPERGASILTAELRTQQNTPKVRQNLAYALALSGDWRSARLLVAEDVPADKIGDRLGQWASTAHPEAQTLRVANVLGVPIAQDDARLTQLALANFPSTPMLAAEAAATMQPTDTTPSIAVAEPVTAEPVRAAELPALAQNNAALLERFVPGPSAPAPAPAPAKVAAAPAPKSAPAAVRSPARPVVTSAAKPAAPKLQSGNHLVQLGSYLTRADADRAWGVFQTRFPVLKDAPLVITKADVKGRIYYRVAAGNLAEGSARSLCSSVKARGQGCLAYSAAKPLPGTIRPAVRVASR